MSEMSGITGTKLQGEHPFEALTAREREVFALIALGWTNREIAGKLVVSVATAARHVHNILEKLGCRNRTELASLARALAEAPPLREGVLAPSTATPQLVGRIAECARLAESLMQVKAGNGRTVMLVGEAGIGKTRLAELAADTARRAGFTVLWGRCYEGDWVPPYAPFADIVNQLAGGAGQAELVTDLGYGAAPLARLASGIRSRLPDLPEPVSLGSSEEQHRILDAVSQFLDTSAKRAPLLLVVEDLHWADASTLNMLRHVARALKGRRICLLGNYRDVEVSREHALVQVLAQIRRESDYESVAIGGLDMAQVSELIELVTERAVEPGLAKAISLETAGNPLFIRELLLHFMEEGTVVEEGGCLTSRAETIAEHGLPEGVREVIRRRVSRLGAAAGRLLTAASALDGPFRFDVVSVVSAVDEHEALDVLDASIQARLVRPLRDTDSYEFTHALISHSLYSELNPSRQARLHRQTAEALTSIRGVSAAEVAHQYHLSSGLPGAEAGVDWALGAASEAEAGYAWERVVAFLEMALGAMPAGDQRRAEATGRLGYALPSVQRGDEAALAMATWAKALFERGRVEEGLEYLRIGHGRLAGSGFEDAGRRLAQVAEPHLLGMDSRPSVWFRMILTDLAERAHPRPLTASGQSEEMQSLLRAWDALPLDPDAVIHRAVNRGFATVEDALARPEDWLSWARRACYSGGRFREAEVLFAKAAERALKEGRLNDAAEILGNRCACHIALGNFPLAKSLLQQAADVAQRVPPGFGKVTVEARVRELALVLGEGWEALNDELAARLARSSPASPSVHRWGYEIASAGGASVKAHLGLREEALDLVRIALPAIETVPGGASNYTRMICCAADALWELNSPEHADMVERNLREKTVALGFRYPSFDGRLALGQMCAVQGRIHEAQEWFAKAREVLEEQGARPLLAICDFDEALALVRHCRKTGEPLDRARVLGLLERGIAQYQEIGMSGWLARARELVGKVEGGAWRTDP